MISFIFQRIMKLLTLGAENACHLGVCAEEVVHLGVPVASVPASEADGQFGFLAGFLATWRQFPVCPGMSGTEWSRSAGRIWRTRCRPDMLIGRAVTGLGVR
jgi:hypothetical protein